ncbi:hypothetical protein [Hyphococcus sp. DH-69]|uniref:hypothetical protein n=1 Tax=Hyphococcus formosus TaxID=3143534 RepID=UPI00398B8B8E
MSAFTAYLVGMAVFTIGLAIGAHLLGAPPIWIGAGVLVVIGLGIVGAATRTKAKSNANS